MWHKVKYFYYSENKASRNFNIGDKQKFLMIQTKKGKRTPTTGHSKVETNWLRGGKLVARRVAAVYKK